MGSGTLSSLARADQHSIIALSLVVLSNERTIWTVSVVAIGSHQAQQDEKRGMDEPDAVMLESAVGKVGIEALACLIHMRPLSNENDRVGRQQKRDIVVTRLQEK